MWFSVNKFFKFYNAKNIHNFFFYFIFRYFMHFKPKCNIIKYSHMWKKCIVLKNSMYFSVICRDIIDAFTLK